MLHEDVPKLQSQSARARQHDAVPWRAGVVATSYGIEIGIRCDDPELLRRAIEILPAGWR